MKTLLLFLAPLILFSESPFRDRPRDYAPPRQIPHSSWVYTTDPARLSRLCTDPTPDWMLERIHKELAPFANKKITQSAIDKTYEQFSRLAPRGTRYRFINGLVYRKGQDPYDMDRFFRTLARLADYPSVPDLPNLELIWNHDDATPLDFQPRDFWITEQFEDQAPIFTYAVKENCPYLVSIPDRFTIPHWSELAASILNANGAFPWAMKQKKAFWRGQCNDFARLGLGEADYETTLRAYSACPRYRISYLSSLYPEWVDAGFNAPGFSSTSTLERVVAPFFKRGVDPHEHLFYAYLPVLDGYTSTYPGYLWRLLSDCVAFKQDSEDSQWFYDALHPYVHYVPIQNRMVDLIEKIAWARENDALCQEIASNATSFVLNNLMMEHIYLYFFRLFEAYRECLDFDTQSLLQQTESDPSWVRIR